MLQMLPIIAILASFSYAWADQVDINTTIPLVLEQNLGLAYLYSDVWTVVNVIELDHVLLQGRRIRDHLDQVHSLCQNNSACVSEAAILVMYKRLEVVDRNQMLLLETHTRKKRGLLNPIGEISKILFGTLSNTDAEYYNHEIDKLYNHTNKILNIVNNQTIIVKDIVTDFTRHMVTFRQNIKQLREWANKTNEAFSAIRANELILTLLQEINVVIEEYDNVLRDIVQSLYSSKAGVIQPTLIPPRTLIQSLNEIYKNHSFTELLFPIDMKHYVIFLKMAKVAVYVKDTRINVIVKVPIPESSICILKKLISLPEEVGVNQYRKLPISSLPVLITLDAREYTTLENIADCTQFIDKKICKREQITRPVSTANKCELELFSLQFSKDCEFHYFSLTNDYIYKINRNSWYIAPITELHFSLICGLYVKLVLISRPSIITLDGKCLLKNEFFTIRPDIEDSIQTTQELQIPRYNFSLNISTVQLPKLNLHFIDTDNLQKDAFKLNHIHEEMTRMSQENRSKSWYSKANDALSYIGYISMLILALFIGYKCGLFDALGRLISYMFIRMRNECCSCCKKRTEASVSYTNCRNIVHAGSASVDSQRYARVPLNRQNVPLPPAYPTINYPDIDEI